MIIQVFEVNFSEILIQRKETCLVWISREFELSEFELTEYSCVNMTESWGEIQGNRTCLSLPGVWVIRVQGIEVLLYFLFLYFFIHSCGAKVPVFLCCGSRHCRKIQMNCVNSCMHAWFLVFQIPLTMWNGRARCQELVLKKFLCQ